MSIIWLITKHNLKWMLALALIFAFASGILSNASSLSQWYSNTLTQEFLDVTRVDFVVGQSDVADKVADIHETIPRLDEVTDVISEMYVAPGFSKTIEIREQVGDKTHTWTSSSIMAVVQAPNGTKFILEGFGVQLSSYLGLERLIEDNDIGAPYPNKGEAVVSRDLAKLLNMSINDSYTVETPSRPLTFKVSGITDLSHYTIQQKITKPDLPLQYFPSSPSVEELKFLKTTGGELYNDLRGLSAYRFNWFAIISPEDSVNLFNASWITIAFRSSINHYVYVRRENLIEPLNIDKTVSNLHRTRDRIELIASEVPASVTSDVLTFFETAAGEVNLFAIIAGSFMLTALPLYWLIASPITDQFVDRKRSEIALLRIRGLSSRGISLAYVVLIATSAVAGGILGALVQANILQILASLHLIGHEYSGANTGFRLTLPDASSLILYIIISLALAILSIRKIIKSISTLQPIEAIRPMGKNKTAPNQIGKLTILLLFLGLVKIIMQAIGWNSTIYFKYPPSNPFLAMGLALFAAFDNYALTALAPVFIAYGFAKIIASKSDKIGFLLHPFSFLAGLRRRKLSFRLLSSEMWRAAAILTLTTIILSYGVASYVSNGTVSEHAWKLAKEFIGGDIRIDCLPSGNQTVEEIVKTIPEILNYTRIDVIVSFFRESVGTSHSSGSVSLFVVDPEAYVNIAYLENAPEFKEVMSNLREGHVVGLINVQYAKYLKGQLMSSLTFPIANLSKTWDQIAWFDRLKSNETVVFNIEEWLTNAVPGTVESVKTLNATKPLEHPLTQAYSLSFARFKSYLADVLLPYTSEGALFDLGGFIIRQEDKSNIKYEQVKSIFLIKLKSGADPSNVATTLGSSSPSETVITTVSEAISVIREGYPGLAVSLDFTQINNILITAISFGGLVAITLTTTMGRKGFLSLIRIRGGKRKDCIVLFLPETVLVSVLACLLGISIGLILGTGFINSMAGMIPHLFTGNTVQTFLDPITWYFAIAVLTVFSVVQIVSIAVKSVVDLGAL
jgi:hypothetical protein